MTTDRNLTAERLHDGDIGSIISQWLAEQRKVGDVWHWRSEDLTLAEAVGMCRAVIAADRAERAVSPDRARLVEEAKQLICDEADEACILTANSMAVPVETAIFAIERLAASLLCPAEPKTEAFERGVAVSRGDIAELRSERDSYQRMFSAAVESLARISKALGIPDDEAECANGDFEILQRIEELTASATTAAPVQAEPPIPFGKLLTKMPALDLSWSPEVQEGWWRCFETFRQIAEQPAAPPHPAEARDVLRPMREAQQIIGSKVLGMVSGEIEYQSWIVKEPKHVE